MIVVMGVDLPDDIAQRIADITEVAPGVHVVGGVHKIELNKAFMEAVKDRFDHELAGKMLKLGADINYADPKSGATALHWSAGYSLRFMVKELLGHDGIDYLALDKKNRLPSELAIMYGDDRTIGALLQKKEAQQAKRENRQIWPKPASLT